MFRLVFLSGPIKGRRLVIQQGDVVIGSDPECPIPLTGGGMAPRHAVVEARSRGHFIRKLDDSARLSVNGDEVIERELHHGDQIDIGETRIIFQKTESGTRGGRRRAGRMLKITSGAVAVILVVQAGILVGLLVYGWITAPVAPVPEKPSPEPEAIVTEPVAEEFPDEDDEFIPEPFPMIEPWML